MRVVVQRVREGSVEVDGRVVSAIGRGLVVLVAVRQGDTEAEAVWLADKVANLRIFADEDGKFNRSLLDVDGEALVVSQFTLYGNARKGRRPDFTAAARPEVAEPLIERFAHALREAGVRHVATGVFQAMMLVRIFNDGPVTIILERE
jgi:D-tyrosyl-tRNA(Tyr) deacylase